MEWNYSDWSTREGRAREEDEINEMINAPIGEVLSNALCWIEDHIPDGDFNETAKVLRDIGMNDYQIVHELYIMDITYDDETNEETIVEVMGDCFGISEKKVRMYIDIARNR